MRILFFTTFISAFLLSCNHSVSSVDPEIGEPFKLKLGDSVLFQNEGLNVHFEELLEDSRCPEGATCFWAGNGRIVIELNDLETELNTYLDPQASNLIGYSIELLDLTPYPKINEQISKDDYTVELVIMEN